MLKVDVVIIGGGIVGACIARELSKYYVKAILVEKEVDVASGVSKANTGIVHAGYNPEPGTLRAKLNILGSKLYESITKELDVPYKKIGSLVLAFEEEEVKALKKLMDRGKKNEVLGMRIIFKDELLNIEPHLNHDVIAALYATTAGIVNPYEMVIANIENAVENGLKVLLETTVTGIEIRNCKVTSVDTNKGKIRTELIVNAAGLYSDEVALMSGYCSFSIKPRRGEYMVLDKNVGTLVSRIIFPIPTPITKGIAITPTIDGNIIIGPTAEEIEDKADVSTTNEGLKRIYKGAKRLVPCISMGDVITSFTGLRAISNTDDFIISPSESVGGFINVAGIKSPGISASPAIALMVMEILQNQGLSLVPKEDFNPIRKGIHKFRYLSLEEKSALITRNPRYGRIICRCETITEGEVVEAIHRPIGARTVNGVKFRTGAGMGRCQGGFCGPRVVSILARELGLGLDKVAAKGFDSRILIGRKRRVRDKDA